MLSVSGCGMMQDECTAATNCNNWKDRHFFTLTQSLLLAGLLSHCVMDYARLEFGRGVGGGGGGGINALPCNG